MRIGGMSGLKARDFFTSSTGSVFFFFFQTMHYNSLTGYEIKLSQPRLLTNGTGQILSACTASFFFFFKGNYCSMKL